MGASDSAWTKIGRKNPYFGVLSHNRFDDGSEREAFFESGAAHIERVFATARELVPTFVPRRALDFGCGVGRLVIPLARRADEVVGIDVSPGMLIEAKRNCSDLGARNVSFCRSPSELSGTFDFVHSFIVFQHIPVSHGLKLAQQLLDHLADDGVGALHFTYHYSGPKWRRGVYQLRKWIPGVNLISNIVRGRAARYPHVQMNAYPLDKLFALLQARGCHCVLTRFSNHDGHQGVMLFFQRRSLPLY